MSTRFIICTNSETVCQGYTDEITEAWKNEITTAASDAAWGFLVVSGVDCSEIETSSNFRNWHGGKYCRMYGRMVVCHSSGDRELCDEAERVFAEARDNMIADIEARL